MDHIIIDYQLLDKESVFALREYYAKYLTEVRKLKQSSVRHYYNSLNTISRLLRAKGLINDSVYEIRDLDELERIRAILYSDVEFKTLDEKGNRMYSAGLNNYYRFVSGQGFDTLKDDIVRLDTPVEAEDPIMINQTVWKRSNILKVQTLICADYKCEISRDHKSFIAEATGKPYMEAHHAIPMRLQQRFECSLDVYANIVCLCPICHRKIHYGIKEERKKMIRQVYESRGERLIKSGINLKEDVFMDIVVNG